MTEPRATVGAPPAWAQDWKSIDWAIVHRKVKRLQMRIAKAVRENDWGKVRSLQRILTRSMAAKLWAVRRVVTNRGKRTPGVDGVIWTTPQQKLQAARSLGRRGYRPQPLRRISIPKKNGKRRPLSIPTMRDRAMQALHLLALSPVAETLADEHSYGYRLERSIADAHGQCFIVLGKRHSPVWIFEGDIESCFDRLSHEWLLAHVPMDTVILRKWLKAGYLKDRGFYLTEEGTPQGGIISPVLATLALDGLENVVREAAPRRKRTEARPKVHLVRFADDLISTAGSRELLVERIIPAICAFLAERGLRLSPEKSRITHIEAGFNFLGANIRKFRGKLLMRPAKDGVRRLLKACRELLRQLRAARTVELIRRLNAKLRGWAHQFRHLVSWRTFRYIDYCIFVALKAWVRRRHPEKNAAWRREKYFPRLDGGRRVFSATYRDAQGALRRLVLVRTASLGLRRHAKILGRANPFDPAYAEYFRLRWLRKRRERREARTRIKRLVPSVMRSAYHRQRANYRVAPRAAFERLEPCAVKVARTVLRGAGGG